MTEIQKRLRELSDEQYAAFQAKLTPNIEREKFIGVRLPALRQYARELAKIEQCETFLEALPHETYDENLLHSILLEIHKGYGETLALTEKFLPYVDNWAVCDTLRPKVFGKNKEALLPHVKRWIASPETYTCRFGIDMLMTHYLDENFREEYLAFPAQVKSEEYYVRMMVAWYYATALAKQWQDTVSYIEKRVLPTWTHRKTIQKAVESYRITAAQKAYLKQYRDEEYAFRRAESGDLSALRQLARESEGHWGFGEDFLETFDEKYNITEAFAERNPVFLLSCRGEIAAFWGMQGEELAFFYVDETRIGSGLGRRLWGHLTAWCAANGVEELHFVTSAPTVGFYEKHGAVVTGTTRSGIDGREIPALAYRLGE